MILGASYSQIPLYETASRLGIATVAVSTPGDWPGFAVADECSYTDISDPEAVLAAAREHEINGIATCCLDAGIRSVGYVCENMGLKGLSANAGKLCSDKYLMKEAFLKGGVTCARHICIHNRAELEEAVKVLNFPGILKAVDLMGSRGIFRCDTKEEVFTHYADTMNATGKDYCLLEEFIEGTMLGCEAMLSKGKLLYCLPNNIENYPAHVPTPIGHSVPYKKQDILGEEVQKQVLLAIQALGMDNCPVNCDLMEKDGKIYVIEITGRAGGNCLPEMVGIYYGIDYYEAIVRLAMDMQAEELFQDQKNRFQNAAQRKCGERPENTDGNLNRVTPNLSHILTSDRDGILKAIHNDNEASPDLLDLSFNVEPGEEIRHYENGRDRLGQVIICGETLDACEQRLNEVLSKLNIEFIS